MITTFDLQAIFKQTWGYVGLPFPEIIIKGMGKQTVYQAPNFPDIESFAGKCQKSIQGVDFYAKNSSGREVYMPIWLFEKDVPADNEKYLVPNTVMSMICKKNIVVTPLVNRTGSVKEEISVDDWEIDIKGVMVGEGNCYPDEQKQILNDWFRKRTALNIENARTAIVLGEGEKVVITSLSFPEIRGFENTQPYELKLISDIPFSLYI